jgi:DNA-directed RNA polymerase specialized sigma24 family protein
MNEHAAAANATNRKRPRLIGRFPKIHVQTRAEMARALQKWRWLLQKHAEAEFGPGALAEEAVRTTMIKLLAIEEPNFPHFLDAAMQTQRNQCHSIRLRLAREAVERERRKESELYDPVLDKPITGAVAEAVERLPEEEQKAFLLAAQGVPPAMIAYLHGRPGSTVRQLLYKARARIRADLEKNASAAATSLSLIPWRDRALTTRHATVRLGLRTGWAPREIAGRMADFIGRLSAAPQMTAGAAVLLAGIGWTPGVSPSPPMAAAPAVQQVEPTAERGPEAGSATSSLAPAQTLSAPTLAERIPAAIHAVVRDGDAAAETPEDVRVTTAATPPRAADAGPPAIVAVGTGQTCQCQVLLQSLDGGTTWTATAGPPVVFNQLVLPPAYPGDPRIFGSNGSGLPPYQAARFGAPFQPLPLPVGRVAVSADFDAGDPRVFVSNTTGVWSLNLAASTTPAAPHLEIETLTTTSASGFVAALATPPATPGGPALLAWTPGPAAAPGSLEAPTLGPTLMACPAKGLCTPLSGIPGLPQFLSVGADAPDTVVAYAWSSTSIYVSRDGGRSFMTAPLPAPGDLTLSVAVIGSAGEVWGSFTSSRGSAVARLGHAGGWIDATRGDALLRSRPGSLVPVDSRRIVEALQGAGYRCTTIDGTSWTPRCPAATG